MSKYTFFTRALRYHKVTVGRSGYPVECVAGVFGAKYAPPWCSKMGSPLRCPDCWNREYRQIRKPYRPRKKREERN